MLVLTRKQNEKIQIGENVTITVVRTKGKTVRIGIEAPSEMSVLRGELVFDADETPAAEAESKDGETQGKVSSAGVARHASVRDGKWDTAHSSVKPAPAPVVAGSTAGWSPLRTMVESRK